MLRGNGGQDIFFAKADRRRFYELLAEGTARFGTRVHGFCLMTNHLHLVLQVGDTPLSRAMQNLSFRYTRFLNARRRRIGHLFQGRYKAILVEADSYLLELVRYVHLNPLRAGLVERPEDWAWSGHLAYLGRERLDWLTTDLVLGRFGGRLERARAGYAAFVREGLDEGHRPEFHTGTADARVLADDGFLERVLSPAERPGRAPSLNVLVRRVAAETELAARIEQLNNAIMQA
jgi:REP element-mobilizing transposase RayT